MVAMVALSSRRLSPNAAVVAVTLIQSHVLPTQPLDPDSGNQCTQHNALQMAVAAKVSGEQKIVENFPLMELILLSTGEVTSPNYPCNYPNNLERTETIQVEQGLILSLQFTAIDIQLDSTLCPDCSCDHLTITDGNGTTLMEKSCGITLPSDITSTSNIVKLVFSTNAGRTYSGWSVSWSAVTPGECQQYVWIILDYLSNSLLPKIHWNMRDWITAVY